MLDDYRDSFPGLNGSSRPAELHAWDSEHLPSTQRLRGSVERCGTLAQIEVAAEHRVAGGHIASSCADLRIRKVAGSLAGKNCLNPRFAGSGEKKHDKP